MNVQQLLESSNQYKVIADDAKKLSSKWSKSGLLEGLKSETDRNESWNGVALPLVRRVFGEIAAKEFVSVQPMNLPSGLVFYLDFKYGTNSNPFSSGGSMYGANASTNVTDITSASLYGAGKFSYSINQYTASITNASVSATSASWAEFNFDSDYSASAAAGGFKKVTVPLPAGYDTNGFRAFTITSGSAAVLATDVQQAFTTVTSNTASFYITGSKFTAGQTGTTTITLFYNFSPQDSGSGQFRGDFEDGVTKNPGTAAPSTIAIPEVNVQLKSEAIVAKTRKLKAQWTPEFAQDLNAYHSVDDGRRNSLRI